MKESPILFSTPMVQAILKGDKTETRRIIKPQPINDGLKPYQLKDDGFFKKEHINKWLWETEQGEYLNFCKYGEIGDILWVRETWQHTKCLNINFEDENYGYVYKADGQPWEDYEYWTWKPSIFMPKEASRIKLQITSIGVERLQDITEESAKKEGTPEYYLPEKPLEDGSYWTYAFNCLWNEINGIESWNQNPYVWVIKFKII